MNEVEELTEQVLHFTATDLKLEKVRLAQDADGCILRVREYVREGWPEILPSHRAC